MDKNKCRTVEEELERIEEEFRMCGNFFVCDVHPNVVRADKIRWQRLWRKRAEVVNSLEYKTLRDA